MEGGCSDGAPAAAAGGFDMDDGLRAIQARNCGTWRLPADPTCASIARRTFRRVAGALGLDPQVAADGVTMVSELATNTLHAKREQHSQCEQHAAGSELWLYLRGAGPRAELVCKVFDAFPGWLDGNVPGRGTHRVPAGATSGRGLEVVHELSRGLWGYHPTRARLAGWQARGKAVWFAVPAMIAGAQDAWDPQDARGARDVRNVREVRDTWDARPAWLSAGAAMTEFEKALAARGFTGRLVRADDPAADMAVLSVCGGLSVWCRRGVAWLRAPGFSGGQWAYGDMVEVAEQAVEAYESLAAVTEPAPLAAATTCRVLSRASPGWRRATDRCATPPPRTGRRRYQSPRERSG